jgi:hypothetical protein
MGLLVDRIAWVGCGKVAEDLETLLVRDWVAGGSEQDDYMQA